MMNVHIFFSNINLMKNIIHSYNDLKKHENSIIVDNKFSILKSLGLFNSSESIEKILNKTENEAEKQLSKVIPKPIFNELVIIINYLFRNFKTILNRCLEYLKELFEKFYNNTQDNKIKWMIHNNDIINTLILLNENRQNSNKTDKDEVYILYIISSILQNFKISEAYEEFLNKKYGKSIFDDFTNYIKRVNENTVLIQKYQSFLNTESLLELSDNPWKNKMNNKKKEKQNKNEKKEETMNQKKEIIKVTKNHDLKLNENEKNDIATDIDEIIKKCKIY